MSCWPSYLFQLIFACNVVGRGRKRAGCYIPSTSHQRQSYSEHGKIFLYLNISFFFFFISANVVSNLISHSFIGLRKCHFQKLLYPIIFNWYLKLFLFIDIWRKGEEARTYQGIKKYTCSTRGRATNEATGKTSNTGPATSTQAAWAQGKLQGVY